MLTFYEFFAGGGMARLGLGKGWNCIFSNELSPKKTAAYRAHFGPAPELIQGDVAGLSKEQLPGVTDLAWASFPCQDLSLAGMGAGLKGKHSGTFTPFWSLMMGLAAEGRPPGIIVLENVIGAMTSHNGRDFEAILALLASSGYRAGAMVIDGVHFVPQSRPRLFIVASYNNQDLPSKLLLPCPDALWHPAPLRKAYSGLPRALRDNWIWWNLPAPAGSIRRVSELVEQDPTGVLWNTREKTGVLIEMMSDANRAKLRIAQAYGGVTIGTVYKRTRVDQNGGKIQRAEVRFDEVAGCLRTPGGGSSRQTLMVVNGEDIRSRLLSPRELARLMGIPESYPIPTNYNEAYHLFGDGLVVPAVAWLEKHLLRSLAMSRQKQMSGCVA